MRIASLASRTIAIGLAVLASSAAQATYWNLFNIEGESATPAAYVTYTTLTDMLADTNRLGVYEPNDFGFGKNIVGTGSDGKTYWSLFNIEGESATPAAYVTYSSLTDMLADTNRLGVFEPNDFGFGKNIVGTGSDGKSYWSLFNIEGESATSAAYVTYASLTDMLADTNRLGVFDPDNFGFGKNIVDGGSDGKTYWSLFNIEGESDESAAFVTYGSRADMLADTNRTSVVEPNGFGFGKNIVGAGSDSFPLVTPPSTTVPEPAEWALMTVGFGLIGGRMRRRSAAGVGFAV